MAALLSAGASLAGAAAAPAQTCAAPSAVLPPGASAPASCQPGAGPGGRLRLQLSGAERAALAVPCPEASIRPALAPDQSQYDPADPRLRDAGQMVQRALGAASVEEEERAWTEILDKYGAVEDAPWRDDLIGRAVGNRGNARARQGKLAEALGDYNESIRTCPWSVDPVLNRGAALEQIGRFEEAARDYRSVLAAAPEDPAGWNNLGNVQMSMGDYDASSASFARATQLAPEFSFAGASRALAEFSAGRREPAIRDLRQVLRKYPGFTDARASLAAALWAVGKEGAAESEWARVDDPRYRDLSWVRNTRRWPTPMADALEAFLQLKSV